MEAPGEFSIECIRGGKEGGKKMVHFLQITTALTCLHKHIAIVRYQPLSHCKTITFRQTIKRNQSPDRAAIDVCLQRESHLIAYHGG